MSSTPRGEESRELQQALETAVGGIEATHTPAAEAVARRRAQRMARLTAAATRLEGELGSDAPEVAELRGAVDSADRRRVALNRRTEREQRRPRVGAREWIAYGSVTDDEGQPAADLRVQLFVHGRKADEQFGQARTDEFGDFVLGPYHERAFCEHDEEPPEVFVKVYGMRNRVVFDGSQEARFRAGQVTHLDIVVSPADGGGKAKR